MVVLVPILVVVVVQVLVLVQGRIVSVCLASHVVTCCKAWRADAKMCWYAFNVRRRRVELYQQTTKTRHFGAANVCGFVFRISMQSRFWMCMT